MTIITKPKPKPKMRASLIRSDMGVGLGDDFKEAYSVRAGGGCGQGDYKHESSLQGAFVTLVPDKERRSYGSILPDESRLKITAGHGGHGTAQVVQIGAGTSLLMRAGC